MSGARPHGALLRVTLSARLAGTARRRHLHLHDRLLGLRRAGDHRSRRQGLHFRDLYLRPDAAGARRSAIWRRRRVLHRHRARSACCCRGGIRECRSARRNMRSLPAKATGRALSRSAAAARCSPSLSSSSISSSRRSLPVLVIFWTSTIPFPQPPTQQAIASMSLANYAHLPMEMVWRGLTNTAVLMVLAPVITLAIALSISWIVLRSRVPGRALFDFVAFLPLSVPSIVFSMAALVLALFVLQSRGADLRHCMATAASLCRVAHLLRDAHHQQRPHPNPSRARRGGPDGGRGSRWRPAQRASGRCCGRASAMPSSGLRC